jgi:MOSC domain-containing protein YiiM
MGDARFPKRFQAAGRAGAYLRIIHAGEVRTGDAVRRQERPDHGVTLGLVMDAVGDPGRAAELLAAPQLPPQWRRYASTGGTW